MAAEPARPAGALRYALAVVVTGALAGAGAAALTLLLHTTERLLFGHATARTTEAAALAAPAVRTIVLIAAGVAAAVLWWLLRRRPIVAPDAALRGAGMPVVRTLLNAALQVAHVAAGASVGREGAPRELGALAGGRLAPVARLTDRQRAVLVACGAGAGLAAVYDVPVAGVLFALETMLLPAVADAVLPAIGCTAVAVLVAQSLGVTPGPLYAPSGVGWGPSLVVLALVLGPVLGLAGAGFGAGVDRLAASRRRPRLVLVLLPLASVVVAAIALPLPQVLGNGQAIAELAFRAGTPALLLLALGLAKAASTAVTLGAGAAGGRLTPSLAIGAGLGGAAGAAWSLVWPGAPAPAAAVVGAATFLAAANRSPLTAIALTIEFTGAAGLSVAAPLLLAIGGAEAAVRAAPGLRRAPRIDRSAED